MRKYKYRKKNRTRKKKSIFRKCFFWLILFFLTVFGAAFYFFIFSPTFQVKEIQISGNIQIPFDELKNTIAEKIDKKIIFFNLKNIFLANFEEIKSELLAKFPQISEVKIIRNFPGVLIAQIKERKPVAVFCGGENNCFFVDKAGIVFEKISQISSQFLNIKNPAIAASPDLGNQVLNQEKLEQILKIEAKLKELKIPIEEILIVSERRLNVKTLDGWEIYFNPEKDLDWQLTELNILLKEKIPLEKRGNLQYVDLRFEKIYIYPENYLD